MAINVIGELRLVYTRDRDRDGAVHIVDVAGNRIRGQCYKKNYGSWLHIFIKNYVYTVQAPGTNVIKKFWAFSYEFSY